MNTLPGNVVDVIRRTVQDIIAQKGECPLATLMQRLRKRDEGTFRPDHWAGFPKSHKMLAAGSKFFIVYFKGDEKTSPCVKLTEQSADEIIETPNSVPEARSMDVPEYIMMTFTSEACRDLRERLMESRDDCLTDDCVLKNKLIYMYHISVAQGCIVKINEQESVFHTGLFKNPTDPLYMVLKKEETGIYSHTILSQSSTEFRRLIHRMDNRIPRIPRFEEIVFEPNRPIMPELSHIIIDRYDRMPAHVFEGLRGLPQLAIEDRDLSNEELAERHFAYLSRILRGSIADTQERLKNQSENAVKYWHRRTNTMCWLIPIRLGLTEKVDLALVLEPTSINGMEVYRAYTILPLKEAFKCANVIGKVTADWLKDAWRD